ncbi:MAG TPA: hypothetical protein VNW68_03240 [Candidatus Limnocylindria bacterium]|nr:hypothetical protein [Candidatus Limnocylindria bacterium]
MSYSRPLAAFLLAGLLAAACAPSAGPTPAPSPTPVTTPSPAPTGAVIVTFRVADEEYRILLRDAEQIDIAQRLLAGEEAPSIPNGVVVRGDAGVNAPWSWHIDPDSVEFADMTIEVCDGRPSDVEQQIITSDRYCPWGAEVIDVAPAD